MELRSAQVSLTWSFPVTCIILYRLQVGSPEFRIYFLLGWQTDALDLSLYAHLLSEEIIGMAGIMFHSYILKTLFTHKVFLNILNLISRFSVYLN